MFKKDMQKYHLHAYQPIIAIILLILVIIWGFYLNAKAAVLPMGLFAGLVFGYALTRGRAGFTGGICRLYNRGEGSLTKALFLMIIVTAFINLAIQWKAQIGGAIPAFVNPLSHHIIPGTQNVRIANIATIIGGFLFGFGMVCAGGCASGTLTDFGEGEGRALVALIFFILAAAPGQWLGTVIDNSKIGKVGVTVWLPKYIGYSGAILVTVIVFGLLYICVRKYENVRKANHSAHEANDDWLEYEKPLTSDEPFKLNSWNTYHHLFIERWSFTRSLILVAWGAAFVLITTGKAWGITTSFVAVDQKILGLFGIHTAFKETAKIMASGLLFDNGTIRNIGIVLGSLICFLLAGRFNFKFNFKFHDMCVYALGGLCMGLGSRIARGCNIGALYSSITNFSLHGYLFMLFLVLGAFSALHIFEGRVNIIPKRTDKK